MQLRGGRLADRLYGGELGEQLFGERGDDWLFSGGGDDVLKGGQGNDTMDGGAGNDRIAGGAGNDSMSGGGGVNRVHGGAGNDAVWGGFGYGSTAFGGPGNDSLADALTDPDGGPHLTTANGGPGADRFIAIVPIGDPLRSQEAYFAIKDFHPQEGDRLTIQLVDANNLALDPADSFPMLDASDRNGRLDVNDPCVQPWDGGLKIQIDQAFILLHGVSSLDWSHIG